MEQLSQADLQLTTQLQAARAAEAELGKQLEQKKAQLGSLQYGHFYVNVWGVT